MVPYKRSQSRILKYSASRSAIRLNDVSSAFRYILWSLANALFKLWHLNPVSLVIRRWRQLHRVKTRMALSIRPRLIDLATDFFLSDERRKRKLLSWVKSILPWLGEDFLDFSACWQDGIVLCALMESISPGAFPRFNLLKPHHRVNNCRLGIQLAMRYLHVTELPLSPEEIAIADDDSEVKICHLVQLLKWKYQKQGSKPTVFSNVTVDQAVQCKCQARGTGIKAGIVGKRTKFNILADTVTNLDLLIEIRGPKNEYNKEKIISVNAGSNSPYRDHVMAAVVSTEDDGKTKVIEDGAGHSFLRQRSQDEDIGHLVIPFDYQCVGEGRFLVTYIPRTAGLHYITVLSRNVHIPGSPFEVKVSDWVSSWNLVPKPRVVPFDMIQSAEEMSADGTKPNLMRKLSNVAQVSKQLTRMKRRILRKVITPNGEEIICDVTPTLSRQNSGDLDLSEIDKRGKDTGLSRSGESQKRTSALDETNSDRGLSPLEVIPERSSSPQNSQKSSRDTGAAFLATVVAARAAAGPTADSFVNSSRNEVASNETNNGRGTKRMSDTIQRHGRQYSKDELGNPAIVITPDCDACLDVPGFSYGYNNQTDTLVENTDNAEAACSLNGLSFETERGSIDVSPSASPTAASSCNMDNNGKSSERHLFAKATSNTESENTQHDSFEEMNGLPSDNTARSSNTPSPHPRVSDVVGTLLSSLKKDKRDGMVSPSQRNYMRSFSLDDSHQSFISYSENVKSECSNDTLPSVSSSQVASSHSNDESVIFSCQKELVSTVDIASASLSHRIFDLSSQESLSKSFRELPIIERESAAEEFGGSRKFTTQQETIDEGSITNSCSGSGNGEVIPNGDIDESQSRGEIIYCPPYAIPKKEPTIMKHDLDQRVNEIIEEMSERDSVAHEEDISETSMDGFVDEDTTFQQETEDFNYAFKLGSKSRSLTDISKDMEAVGFNPVKRLPYFSISDFRPQHKITWSQHRSLSEDWNSNTNRDGLTRNEWAEITPFSINKPAFLEQSSDTEQDILSSDCEEDNDDKSDNRYTTKSQWKINGFTKDKFDALFRNPAINQVRGESARKRWSESRSMSFPCYDNDVNEPYWNNDQNCDVNEPHWNNDQNGDVSFNRTTRLDQLSKMRKWATFDVLDTTDEASAHNEEDNGDELSQIQNGLKNGELDEEEDEMLQIITEYNSYQPNMGDSARDINGDLSSGKQYVSYLSSREETSPILDYNKISVTEGQEDDVTQVSPISDASTKSDNSDWSDNEESPTRSPVKLTSSGKNDFLKGDWSPQFVDLTYPDDVTSRLGSTNEGFHSPVRSQDNSNAITSSAVDSDVAIMSENYKLDSEDKSVVSAKHCDMVSQETQYENLLETLSPVENITNRLSPKDGMAPLINKSYSKSSTLSQRQYSNNYRQYLPEYLPGDHCAGISSDKPNVYIKRRSRPVYTHDSLSGRYTCQDINVESQTKSENLINNRQSNTESHSSHNSIHAREVKPQFSNLVNTNSIFSTSEFRSSDSTTNLPVDNWPPLSKSCTDHQCKQAAHFVNDGKKYPACQYKDDNCHARENFLSRSDPFREHTLTPTKYRVQHENTRGIFKTNQKFHERMMSSQDSSDIFSTSRGHSDDSTIQEKNRFNLKLIIDPGSVMVSLCPGDIILTPTKYRRNKSYRDKERTINSKVHRESCYTAFDAFSKEINDSNSNPAVNVCELPTDVHGHSHRTKSNSVHDECKLCEESIIPIRHEGNNQNSCLVCADNSKKTSKHFNKNGVHANSKNQSNSSHGNVIEGQIQKMVDSCLSCESPVPYDSPADEYDLTTYVKKRRKMLYRDAALLDMNQCCCNDNKDVDDKNIISYHQLDDKLCEPMRDINRYHDNKLAINTDNLQQFKLTQHQPPSPQNHHQQYYTESNDYSNQFYQKTNQQGYYLSQPQNKFFEHQEQHSRESKSPKSFASHQELDHPFKQSSLWSNLPSGDRSDKQSGKQNTKQQQCTGQHEQNSTEQNYIPLQHMQKLHNIEHNEQHQFNISQQVNHQHQDRQCNSPQQINSLPQEQKCISPQQFSNKHQQHQLSVAQQLNHPKHEQQCYVTHQRNYPRKEQLSNYHQHRNHQHKSHQFDIPHQLNQPPQEQQFNSPLRFNQQHQEQQLNSLQQFNTIHQELQSNSPQNINQLHQQQQFNPPQKINHPHQVDQFDIPHQLNQPPQEQQFNSPQKFNLHQQFKSPLRFNQQHQEQQLNSLQQFNTIHQELQSNSPQNINQLHQQQQFNPPQKINHPHQEQQFYSPRRINQPHQEQQFNQPRQEQQFNQPRQEQQFNQPRQEQQFNQPRQEQQFNQPRQEQQFNQPRQEQQFNQPHQELQFNQPPQEQQFNQPYQEQQFNQPRQEQQFNQPHQEQQFKQPYQEQQFNYSHQFNQKHQALPSSNSQQKNTQPRQEQQFNQKHKEEQFYSHKFNPRHKELQSFSPQKINHPRQEQQFNYSQQVNQKHPKLQSSNSPQKIIQPRQEQRFNQTNQEQQPNSPQKINQPRQEQQFNYSQQFNQKHQELQPNSPQKINQERQQQQNEHDQQLQQQHPHKHNDKDADNNQAMVLKRQSTVDTLDSGIPDDSTHCYGQTSGDDIIGRKMLDLENGFDFNIFLQP